MLGASYPWCAGWAAELKELFAAYVEAKHKHNVLDYDDLLLSWAQMMSDAAIADDVGGKFLALVREHANIAGTVHDVAVGQQQTIGCEEEA